MDPQAQAPNSAGDTSAAPANTRLPAREVVACVLFGVVLWSVAIVAIVVPRRVHRQQERTTCLNNLSQLGQIYLIEAQMKPDEAAKFSGPAIWLSYRKDGSAIRRGDERVLVCPLDENIRLPESEADRSRWDGVDLAHVPRSLCSYAARDFNAFPLGADPSMEREPIGACLQHPGIAIIVFAGGDAQYLRLAELGLTSDDEKIVGPTSKSPMLRVFTYGDGSVR